MSLPGQAQVTDYVWLLWYRRRLFAGLALVLLALGATITFLLPDQYTATATLLFEQPRINVDAETTTPQVHTAADIQTTRARIMTAANLEAIVQKRFPEARFASPDEITDTAVQLKKDILVHVDNVDVVDQKTGNAGEATIGFTISYTDGAREIARGVVSDVVNLFLQERAGKRASGAADAVSLLEKESQQLEDRIEGLENDLARYKRSNASTLPELTNLKLTQLERFSHEFTDLQNQIRELENRKAMRTADLALLSPNVGIYSEDGARLYSPDEQLLLLRAEYAEKSSRYSPEYPDLVNLAGEIRGLEAYVKTHQEAPAPDRDRQLTAAEWKVLSRSDTDTGQVHTVRKGDTLSAIARQYGVDAQNLADLNKMSPVGTLQVGQTLVVTPGAGDTAAPNVYPAANPDVKRLANKMGAVGNQPPVSSSQPTGTPASRTLGDNPNYLRTRAELDAVDRDLVSSRSRAAELQTTIRQYEEELSRTPEVERELNEILRKLDGATTQMARIKEKQLDAELARAIQNSDAGGQFALAEPISTPARPDKPNRSVMLFLSMLLAVAGSSGVVLLTELQRKVIYDARCLQSTLNIQPLVVIPRIPPRGGNIKRLGWQGRVSEEAA